MIRLDGQLDKTLSITSRPMVAIPFEDRNVKQATVAESLPYPSSPGHNSPPQDLLLFRKNKVTAS